MKQTESAATDDLEDDQVQQDLLDSLTRFEDIAAIASDWFWESDDHHRFTMITDAVRQFNGNIDPQNYIGQTRKDLADRAGIPDGIWEPHQAILDKRQPFRDFTYQFLDQEGRTHHWSISGIPIFDNKGMFRGYRGVGRDITDRMETLEELQQHKELLEHQISELKMKEIILQDQAANQIRLTDELTVARDELSRLNEQKNRFFSIVAHDLKSPLSGLMGLSEILARDFDRMDSDKVKDLCGHLHSASEMVYELLENLLDWSRIQMGHAELTLTTVSVNEAAEHALALFKASSEKKGITLSLVATPNCQALADAHSLSTIVRNLVGNAVKYTNSGGNVRVSIETDAAGNCLLHVADTGIGIPEKLHGRLMALENTTSSPGTAGESGTGLGLVLCGDLARMMHGSLGFTSVEGEGSTFTLTLPGPA